MRPICWLHISDIHMRPRDAWSQDVVLQALADDIQRRRRDNLPDFILVSGDLAFSGKAEEYALIPTFFDALSAASGVPRERIFCIPGNHDIDRERQKLAFIGARVLLQDQNRTDALLSPESRQDLSGLLQRQEHYHRFLADYFRDQKRIVTEDGLGYVCHLTIEDVRLAVVALDSAWLSEGGVEDHGKLLIGERQVINALRLAQGGGDPPHVVIAMSHHPLHILHEFDRRPIQTRVERSCQFLHCGHLHDPETRPGGYDARGCLTLAAGASFETRQTQNSYSIVVLDLVHARRTVTTVHYNPRDGLFAAAFTQNYPIEVQPSGVCGVATLAACAAAHNAGLAAYAHYLAALILDQKAEIVVPAADGSHAFGSLALLAVLARLDSVRNGRKTIMRQVELLRCVHRSRDRAR
jgi:predicted phosphodiesterase